MVVTIVYSYSYSYSTYTINKMKLYGKSDFSSFVDQKNRPPPVNVPRRRMELRFAVQLMRTSYNAVDWLDVVPMDEFQKDFFTYRQDNWDSYRTQHSNIMQGDLADPTYFDYISFAQYSVSLDKLKNAKSTEFLEKFNAAGETRRVKRNPLYNNNDILPLIHSKAVGQRLTDYIYDTYSKIVPKISIHKKGSKIDGNLFVSQIQNLLDIFTINSYCAGAEAIEIIPEKGLNDNYALLRVSLSVPANLWSSQIFRNRKADLMNDFEIKVLQEFANRQGLTLKVVRAGVEKQLNSVYYLKLTEADEPYQRLELWSEGEGGVLIDKPVPTIAIQPLPSKEKESSSSSESSSTATATATIEIEENIKAPDINIQIKKRRKIEFF